MCRRRGGAGPLREAREFVGGLRSFAGLRLRAVGLGHLEEGCVIGIICGVADEEEGVGAGGDVGFEVEAEGFACGSLGESGDQAALLRRDVGTTVGEEHLDLFDGQGAEADEGAAGAGGGEEFTGVLCQKDEVDGGGRPPRGLRGVSWRPPS